MKNVFFAFLSIVVLIIFQDEATGDDFKLIPSISFRQEYNDNIFFDENNEEADFITIISPGLALKERTERLNAEVTVRFDNNTYAKNDELDDWDNYCKGSILYQLSEKLYISSEVSYTRDSRTDRDFEETGQILGTDVRERRDGSLAGGYTISEMTSVFASYSYLLDDFEDNEDNTDSRLHSATIGLEHILSYFTKRTLARINYRYDRYDFTDYSSWGYDNTINQVYTIDDLRYQNSSLTIGASRELSEVLDLVINMGGRCTGRETRKTYPGYPADFGYRVATFEEKRYDWGGVGDITLSSTGEYTRSSFTVSQDIGQESGNAGLHKTTSLRFKINRRFTEELQGDLSASFFLKKRDGDEDIGDLDKLSYYLTPGIRYAFTRDFFVRASYSFSMINEKEENRVNDTDKTRNLFFIELRYQYPFFE